MSQNGKYKNINHPLAPLFFERPLLNDPDYTRPPKCVRRIIGRHVRKGRLRKQPYRLWKGSYSWVSA